MDRRIITLVKISNNAGETIARFQKYQLNPYVWRNDEYTFAGFDYQGTGKLNELANYRAQIAIASDPMNVSTLITARSWLRERDYLRRCLFEFFTFDLGNPNAIVSDVLQGASAIDDESGAKIVINLRHPLDAIKQQFPTHSLDNFTIRLYPLQTSASF
jgi:hypothetical protein